MKSFYIYALIFVIILTVFSTSVLLFYNKENKSKVIYELSVIQENGYWLYEISENNKPLIRQEHVPALNGNKRFKTKNGAQTIGNIAIKKLNNNNFPIIHLDDIIKNNIEYIESN